MPDTGYHPDRNPGNYCFEHRLAGGTCGDLSPQNKDSTESILQRLFDFQPSSDKESENK